MSVRFCITLILIVAVSQWLTTHEPSTEHDLSTGLRENFNPAARWRTAINATRAMHRLGSFKKHQVQETAQQRTPSADTGKDSGNWAGRTTSDEESYGEEDEEAGEKNGVKDGPPSATHELKREETPAAEKLSVDDAEAKAARLEGERLQDAPRADTANGSDGVPEPRTPLSAEEEKALNMPGSFDVEPTHADGEVQEGLIARMKKMRFFGT
jgi:calcium/calmodulin-dependent protein kinase I